MNKTDFLIVGGSAAGTTAAEVIRSLAPDASITIVSDEPHEEYSRVLLPQYITHKVNLEQIFLKKPEWYQEKNIVLLKGKRAKKLETSKKIVGLSSGEEIQYGKLLVAIGGEPVRLNARGADLGNIVYLRTIEDATRLIETARASKKATVVGGGLVSLDFAEGLAANGVSDITILVRDQYYWASKLDRDSSRLLQSVLEKNGMRVVCGEEVDHFDSRDTGSDVGAAVTKSGNKYECDLVAVGIGIKSDLSWLAGSAVKTDRAIETNEYLETSVADVYAAGDCAQFHDVIFDRQHIMGNWANATSQGAAVARNMAGERTVFESASSYSDSFFEGTYSFVGVIDSDFADEVISRGSFESGKISRIFVKTIGGVMRVVGATIINNPAEVAPLTAAVKNKLDISSYREKLSDPNFDLRSLSA